MLRKNTHSNNSFSKATELFQTIVVEKNKLLKLNNSNTTNYNVQQLFFFFFYSHLWCKKSAFSTLDLILLNCSSYVNHSCLINSLKEKEKK